MNWFEIAIPVLALSGLCAGWMLVQILARRLGTKNHLEQKPGCGNCRCYGGPCEREMPEV